LFLAARARPAGSDRKAHDALRALWLLAHEEDPQVGALRARVERLPPKASSYIESRAVRLIPRLFSGQTADHGFPAWAHAADGPDLVKALRVLSADGGRIVPGRSRGGGKRSKSKLEPRIGRQVRGTGTMAPTGGRPKNADQDTLVMHLAIDWSQATGERPEQGRSDATGFGELVHCVFDWIAKPGARQALRRYWTTVKSAKVRPTAGGFEVS
jgi:hypothetical protein